jgi:hypothetical protein
MLRRPAGRRSTAPAYSRILSGASTPPRSRAPYGRLPPLVDPPAADRLSQRLPTSLANNTHPMEPNE